MGPDELPGLELRPARQEELDSLLRVVCEAFSLDYTLARELFYRDPLFRLDHKWVAVLHNRVVSTLTLLPSPMQIGDAVISVAGIAGVATLQEYRRRGLAGRLITACLRALPGMGYSVAALIPFETGFYRRFGFETSAGSWNVAVAPRELPRYLEADSCRQMTEADEPAVQEAHRNVTAGRSGVVLRDARRWEFVFWNNRQRVVWGRPAEGYLFYELMFDGQATRLRVRELCWASEGARRALTGFLAKNRDRADEIQFSGALPEAEALCSAAHAGGGRLVAIERADSFMARVVDIPRLLCELAEARDLPAVELELSDPLLAANSGRFVLGHGTVMARCSLPIERLAPMAMGHLDASACFTAGGLSLGRKGDLALLQQWFPTLAPSLMVSDQF